MRLEEIAWITDSAQGIGEETIELFIKEGPTLIICNIINNEGSEFEKN